MSRKNPIFVDYNKYGYIINLKNTFDNDTNIKYILHPIEWTVCGKLINNFKKSQSDNFTEGVLKNESLTRREPSGFLKNESDTRENSFTYKIIPLNENENMWILNNGLRYQYNTYPSNYWDATMENTKSESSSCSLYKNYNDMTIKELIIEVNQRDPNIIKKYINDLKNQLADCKTNIKLTKIDYLNILNSSVKNNCFYPLISDDRLTANNINNWIYYNNYQCWINKNGERCSCISCYRIRDNDEYSILNFKNNHCVYCLCSDCICDNTKFYNIKEVNDNINPSKCDSCIICKNDSNTRRIF
jgi:hypothetical protein